MEINIEEIRNGSLNNKKVWICDLRTNNDSAFAKPIRSVKPTEVIIQSNETLPKNKKVYYSESHFRPLKRDGEPSSKIISLFDNTGYRSYTGVPVNVYDNEEEAVAKYKEQKEYLKELMLKEIRYKQQQIEEFEEKY